MTRYEVIGRPNVLADQFDQPVGTIVEADLDKDHEQALIDTGVIRVLPKTDKPEVSDEREKARGGTARPRAKKHDDS